MGPGRGPGWGGRESSGRVRVAVIAAIALVLATLAAAALEDVAGIVDASSIYLVPVVVVAGMAGTWPAIAVSGVAFLTYDFLFTVPRYTLAVQDPTEWLSLVLFLIVAVAIGRLAALLRERADEAERRVREGVALVAIGRASASAHSFRAAAEAVAELLRRDAEMDAVRIVEGGGTGDAAGVGGIVVAETGTLPERPAAPWTLVRDVANGTSDWIRVRGGTGSGADPAADAPRTGDRADAYEVPLEADGTRIGAILAYRAAGSPLPGRGARRLLSLAADQLGAAAIRDDLRDEVTAAEVARQGDALRGAILDSVSHDLRTPLAAIRALAGRLADDDVRPAPAAEREIAGRIDREAERLAGLVGSLLDMSRIQAGAIAARREPYDLPELVETVVERVASGEGRSRLELDLADDLPPVLVDPVLVDVALGNVVDNALRHAPAPARVRIAAAAAPRGAVRLEVDDAGPGVPDDALPRLFERFYRAPAGDAEARPGIGMGLAIARGFLEATGGRVRAERSPLGGLGIRIELPAAAEPPAPVEPATDPDGAGA